MEEKKKAIQANLSCKYDEYIDTFECKKCIRYSYNCITCTDAPSIAVHTQQLETDWLL